jgi:hypothetical protein
LQGQSVKNFRARAVALAAFAVAGAAAVAGCSIDADYFTIPDLKRPKWTLEQPNWNLYAKDERKERPITPDDLVSAEGHCAGEVMPAEAAPSGQALYFTAGPQAARPEAPAGLPGAPPPGSGAPVVRGVALGMTECEVVRAIGPTDHAEVTTNERGQRAVTLTYVRGERPGIYRFVGGRLAVIERAPEPPAPPKPEKTSAKKRG